jgi:hypothetical protein
MLRMLASNVALLARSHDAFFLIVLAVVGAGLMASAIRYRVDGSRACVDRRARARE